MDFEFCVSRWTAIADSNKYSMSPANAASIRSRMQCWMDSLLRCWNVEGAKINMSRWRSSHQNGADVDWSVVVV